MKKEEWIKQLHDRMGNHEEAAPEGLWEKIEAALPATEKAQKRSLPWRRWAAAAAVAALLLGGAGYWLSEGDNHMPEMTRKNVPTTEQTEQSKVTASLGEKVANSVTKDDDGMLMAHVVKREKVMKDMDVKDARDAMDARDSKDAMDVKDAMDAMDVKDAIKDREDLEYKEDRKGEKVMAEATNAVAKRERETAVPMTASTRDGRKMVAGYGHRTDAKKGHITSNADKRWSAGLLAANVVRAGQPSQLSTQPVVMSAAKAFYMGYSPTEYTNAMSSGRKEQMHLPGYEENTEHHMPVAVGLSVRYRLNDRWALESGLVYSRLTSDFTRRMQHNELTDHQTLHYVGLPLVLDYKVWGNNVLETYVQAGGQVDANVKAQLESEGVELNISKDRLQWSANAAVGAQVNVTPALGIYVEPGLRYYFDNKSQVENIFKDKKLSFQLQIGLRIDIK